MDETIDKRTIVVQISMTILLALLFTGMIYFVYSDMPVEWWEHTHDLGWSFENLFLSNIAMCSAPALLIAMLYDSRVK